MPNRGSIATPHAPVHGILGAAPPGAAWLPTWNPRPTTLNRDMFKVTVPFSTTTCLRCKAHRQTAQACPDCGRKAERHEVDFALLARRKVIDDFRRNRLPGQPGQADPETVGDQAGAAFERLGRALRYVAESGRDASRLRQAFEDIDSLVASWPEDALPRPHRNSGRRISQMLKEFQRAMEMFVEALYDGTMDAAQAHAREGQAILDSVGVGASQHRTEDWQDLGRKALGRVGGAPLELTRLDERLVGSLSHGSPSAYPAGFGLQLFVMDAIVDDLFDRVNVDALRAALSHALASQQPTQTALFLQPEWRAEALRVGRISTSGWRTLARVVDDDPDDMEIVDALLSLVEANREAVLRFTLATVMSLSGDTWAGCQARSAGANIKAADSKFPSLKLRQVDSGLRHVGAHRAFDVHGDVVELRLDGGQIQSYSAEDFLDRCLHALEVTAAFQLALFDWVGSLGVEWPSSPLQRASDREDALAFILGASGFKVVSAGFSDEVVEVTVTGEVRPWGPIIAALSPLLPSSVRTLSIQGRDGALNPFTVSADLEPVRAFLAREEGSGFDRESVLLIAALQAIHSDGESEVPADWWPGILAHAAIWRDNDTVASQTKRLLAIRPLVMTHGDPSVLADLTVLLASAREGLLRRDDHPKAPAFSREPEQPALFSIESRNG